MYVCQCHTGACHLRDTEGDWIVPELSVPKGVQARFPSPSAAVPPTVPAVNALQIASDVHTPACCDGLNISHLAKDLKCCRHSSPLTVTALCRACSAFEFSKFKRGRLLFGQCTPCGSDPPLMLLLGEPLIAMKNSAMCCRTLPVLGPRSQQGAYSHQHDDVVSIAPRRFRDTLRDLEQC